MFENLRSKLSARLPATQVTPEMRQMVDDICRANDVSIGELQRFALSLFLAKVATDGSDKVFGRSKEHEN